MTAKTLTYMAKLLVLVGLFLSLAGHQAMADRLKDMTSIAGVRSNQLVGYGVVVGLAGTGDGSSGLTLQSLQSMVRNSAWSQTGPISMRKMLLR